MGISRYQIRLIAASIVLMGALFAPGAHAQDGYHVGEGQSSPPQAVTARFARIEYVAGDVTWRPDGEANWKPARQYTALKPGAQIWAVGDGKAEIRFEDGAIVRLGQGAVATIDTLFNDSQGAFTRIAFSGGSGMLVLKSEKSVYQADLPLVSVIATGPSRIRLSSDLTSHVAVRSGKATLQGKAGKLNLKSGDSISVDTKDNAYTMHTNLVLNSWDRWSDERDHIAPARSFGSSTTVIVPTIILGGGRGHRHGDYGDGDRRH